MFNVSALLLLDDVLKPATPLTSVTPSGPVKANRGSTVRGRVRVRAAGKALEGMTDRETVHYSKIIIIC